ncbi:MAG TPA: CDP-diacylglycerol--serine O-phosphatidyltransferase [Bryobacteraceae bacterium]|nr:CDP-diacylglycerol--serine O-phosphatidyltransferase [Bryobacteraceae bacterium]
MIRRLNFPRHLTSTADRRPTRVAYALPTFFTAGNMFLGFVAVIKAFEGALATAAGVAGANLHFAHAAQMIGVAVLLDGLDGRIARMTNTTSDFGREMDSLADVITFGLAPAVLAFAWGFHSIDTSGNAFARDHLLRLAYFVCFLFLCSGAVRLARFNVTTNPIPKNPGRADRKYFVGLPIPAGAGLIAAIVYASQDSHPLQWWPLAVAWLLCLALLSFLMVCTWRYRSFKDLNLMRPRSPVILIAYASFIYLVWNWPQMVLLFIGVTYVGSGVLVRLGGIARRLMRKPEAA